MFDSSPPQLRVEHVNKVELRSEELSIYVLNMQLNLARTNVPREPGSDPARLRYGGCDAMLACECEICCELMCAPAIVGQIPCISCFTRGRDHVIATPLKELIHELN